DLRLHALQRVFERERDLHLDVVAALTALFGPAAAYAAAEHPAEDVAQVAQIPEVEPLGGVPREPAAGSRTSVGGAERVVLLPLLGVREHVVRVLDLLEALLGLLVARIRVRVVLTGKLPVGLLDLVG